VAGFSAQATACRAIQNGVLNTVTHHGEGRSSPDERYMRIDAAARRGLRLRACEQLPLLVHEFTDGSNSRKDLVMPHNLRPTSREGKCPRTQAARLNIVNGF
jgi:hypothetical protein